MNWLLADLKVCQNVRILAYRNHIARQYLQSALSVQFLYNNEGKLLTIPTIFDRRVSAVQIVLSGRTVLSAGSKWGEILNLSSSVGEVLIFKQSCEGGP